MRGQRLPVLALLFAGGARGGSALAAPPPEAPADLVLTGAPVESIAVLPGLYAAVTRQDAKGWPEGGWHPEERVTMEEALRMFSEGAAYAAFEEKDRGRIAAGMRADFTVLGKDPTAIPPAELLTTPVVFTIVGGIVEYDGSKGQAQAQ